MASLYLSDQGRRWAVPTLPSFVVEVPSLPGCVSQGETRDEALENIKEAIALHIDVLLERGLPVPDDNEERFAALSVKCAEWAMLVS